MFTKIPLVLFLVFPFISSTHAQTQDRIHRVETEIFPEGSNRPHTIKERMDFYKVPGVSVAVIDDGKIEWAKGYGFVDANHSQSVTPETLFQAASISKPVTAMLVLKLMDEGVLSLDSDVNETLLSWKVPNNEYTQSQKVTLRRILSHTAGTSVPGFEGYAANARVPTLLQILDGIAPSNSLPIRVEKIPSGDFQYSGGGYAIMQQLMLDITRQEFNQLAHTKLFMPINMTNSTFQQPLPARLRPFAASGHDSEGKVLSGKWHTYPELAAAGLWTTATDLAKFAIDLQQSLGGGTKNVLTQETAEQFVAPMVPVAGIHFGLGLRIEGQGEDKKFAHTGGNVGFRCIMIAYAHQGRGTVVMTNGDNGHLLMKEIVATIARTYEWSPIAHH